MLKALFSFEIQYQIKQKACIGFCIIFLAFGFMLGSQGFAPINVNFNSAYQISYNMALLSLGCVFAIMFFSINGILRDKQYRTESIIYSTSIQKKDFFFSRFFGVFIVSLFVVSMALVGFALGTLSPSLPQGRLASFNITHYLWSWIVIVIPNVFICTSIIFSVGIISRNNIAVYTSSTFIYASHFMSLILFNSPLLANTTSDSSKNIIITAFLDPFGRSAFFEQTQFWTAFQMNNELIHFTGNFMWNRILWVSISLLLILITYKYSSFKKMNQKIKKTANHKEEIFLPKIYKPIHHLNNNNKSQWLSFLSRLKIEINNVFKSLPFITVVLIWIIIIVTEIYSRLYQSNVYFHPRTDLLINLIKDPLPFLSLFFIVFYSGELVWREKTLRFSNIIESTPVSNVVFFLSKAITLLLLPILLITLSILISVIFQISKGYYNLDIWQYVSMYYFFGIGFLFNILLALFFQYSSSNKYVGMLITGMIIIIFQSPVATILGIESPLLRIGYLPQIEYNNLVTSENSIRQFHYYAIYWTVFSFAFSMIGLKIWQRGDIHKFNIKRIINNWKKTDRIIFGCLIIIFFVLGIKLY